MTRSLTRLGWFFVTVAGLVGVLAFPSFYSDMILALKKAQVSGIDERLTNIQPDHAPWLTKQVGGKWGRYGWSLSSGEKGLLRMALPGSQPGILRVQIRAYPPGQFSAHIVDGDKVHEIPNSSLSRQIITIPVSGSSELVISAVSNLSEKQLVVDRISVSWFSNGDNLPSIWLFAVSGILFMIGWGAIIGHSKDPNKWRLWVGTLLILTITIIGFDQRWILLEASRSLPVDPDVDAFMHYAQSLDWFTTGHGFYSGTFGEREPLHVAALNLWLKIWGESFQAIRWYTVVLSSILVASTGVFVWALSKQWSLGAIGAGIMALNPVLIEESVRGLRLESFSLFFLAVLSVWLWGRGWIGAVLLGLLTGWMGLLRAPALGVMLPVMWFGWLMNWCRRYKGLAAWYPHQWRNSHLVVVSMLALALGIPHLYGLYKIHGDPSWPSYGYARWNANVEFPERLGTAGFPSPAEFATNAYAGPRITYWDYLFKMHSIPTLVRGQVKGWGESTTYMSASATPHLKKLIILFQANGIEAVLRHMTFLTVVVFSLLALLTTLGWLQLWRHNLFWWVPLLSIWGTWYVAYLYNVRLVEPFRHTGHVYPLLIFTTLWGGYHLYYFIKNVIERRSN